MENAEIEEIFQSLGPVSIRRLFGGKGIYCDGMIIAIVFQDGLLLKADASSAPEFAEAGAQQWRYAAKTGKDVAMPYWSVPEDAWDDPDIMTKWVRLAFEAAMRSR